MSVKGKIHIVHITQHLEIGGLESFIVEFCRKLDKDAFTATVLCLNGYDDLYKKSLNDSGVAVHLFKKRHKYDHMFLWRAASFLKSIQADIVHSHGGCFLYSSLIGKFAGVKGLVYTVHGLPVTSGLQARLEEFFSCAMTDRIVAVSDEIAADLKSRQTGAAHKVDVIINGIDTDRYRPIEEKQVITDYKSAYGLPKDRRIIGAVGRLEKIKNFPLLLNAFADLVHSGHHDCHLVLIGSGRESGSLKSLAEKSGVTDRVSFMGMQYDLHRIYPLFDVFVLPSFTEGTSLSLLEAQACGVPAVVTDVGGNSRIITNGINGFLSPSGDRAAMVANLERTLNCAAQLTAMKKASRLEILDRFNVTAVLKRYQTIYSELVKPVAVLNSYPERDEYDAFPT